MTTTSSNSSETEDLEDFRQRARAFAQNNLGDATAIVQWGQSLGSDEAELAAIAHEREVQRRFFDAGLAGICVPREYAGQGFTPAHQRVLNEELAGYDYPCRTQVPTMNPCLPVLLEFGTEEQKHRCIPPILRGEALWVQVLSEPGSGSDLAGALTTAVRDGDEWVINGSKIWTTGAWFSDFGLCLARTNSDVPKHRGLTVFILPVRQPGVELHRIEMLNGNTEFCQEFLNDVRVPDSNRIGDIDQGWSVCIRWMFHERMLYNSPLVTTPVGATSSRGSKSLLDIARDAGRLDDRVARDLVGEGHMLELAREHLDLRMNDGVATGAMPDQAAAITRLFKGMVSARVMTIEFELAASAGVAWTDEDGTRRGIGDEFLVRQAKSIGGGTVEMARNVVSERLLGMPREPAHDRDVPFRDVAHGRART